MIIGIHGRARCGKDTTGDYLVERYGFTKYAFADPMKTILMEAFQWERRHMYGDLKEVVDRKWGFSPRFAMQLFGTEFGRRLNPDLWLIFAADAVDTFCEDGQSFVIPDIRFENEAEFVRSRGGPVWHIVRAAPDAINGVPGHASEGGVSFLDGDVLLVNDSGIRDLYLKIDALMEQY